MEDNLNYYRRRIAEELAAAQHSSSEGVAAVHRSLAERYMALAGEPQPFELAQAVSANGR